MTEPLVGRAAFGSEARKLVSVFLLNAKWMGRTLSFAAKREYGAFGAGVVPKAATMPINIITAFPAAALALPLSVSQQIGAQVGHAGCAAAETAFRILPK
jgi:hypothetical protein